jgi:hypothetical protein
MKNNLKSYEEDHQLALSISSGLDSPRCQKPCVFHIMSLNSTDDERSRANRYILIYSDIHWCNL